MTTAPAPRKPRPRRNPSPRRPLLPFWPFTRGGTGEGTPSLALGAGQSMAKRSPRSPRAARHSPRRTTPRASGRLLAAAMVPLGVLGWVLFLTLPPMTVPDLVLPGAAAAAGAPAVQPAGTAEWPTWMGGPQRTGNLDGKPGPAAKGRLIWAFRANPEMFIAAPVPAGDRLILASVGALGPGAIRCLPTTGDAAPEPTWKLPDQNVPGQDAGSLKMQGVVSAPAVAGGWVVVGEGLHQHTQTQLRCLSLKDGTCVWSLPVESHLEGGPAIVGGRVISGAGAQGVVCVELGTARLPGAAVKKVADLKPAEEFAKALDKDLPAAEAAAIWLREYQRQVKIAKEDDLPPVEVPRPQPKPVWQAGAGRLHVDAAVCVDEKAGRVYAGSARIEDENVGLRVVAAFGLADGKPIWETAAPFNPWGPPSLAGDKVLVGCSSIRFSPTEIAGSKGCVLALDAADGKQVWRRDLGGGVLSAVAVDGATGYVACTDGFVHALDVATGEVRWKADAGGPLFATPAVAGGTVYAVTIAGVVHALDGKSGAVKWTLKLADHDLGGTVYGSPAVAGGRLYVAVAGDKPGLACIGDDM